MGSLYINVVIKGVSVGTIEVESDGEPSITVRWKTGQSMVITGPAMLVFRYRHRSIVLYWDGVILRDRTPYTVSSEFPLCAPFVHANPAPFCLAYAPFGTGFMYHMRRYFENTITIDDL